jgi:ADP-ribose pyrophosphatase
MADEAGADAHLRETTVASSRVWRGLFLDVRQDRVRLPDGNEAGREYIVHPGAVVVVPLLSEDRLLMVRQWRHPLERVMLEFPAGKLEAGEPPLGCAMRELEEETGHRAAEWARAGLLHNAIAYSNEGIEVWFARGLVPGPARPDEGEFVEVVAHTAQALAAAIRDGAVTDAKTMVGLLWWQNWQSGLWPLDWLPAPNP